MKKKKMKLLNLEEIHAALTNILAEFDRVCRAHNLCYTIAYGTLLGAIRHKGFIPWDDDVDVCMPRPDYEKFYAMVKSGEIQLGEHFILSEDRGKKAFYPFVKLMDTRYKIKSWSHIEVPYLFLDIFPIDGVPDDEKLLKKSRKKRIYYNGICALARWAVPDKKWMIILRGLFFPFYFGCWIQGKARACRKSNENALKYDFNSYDKCSVMNFSLEKWVMKREKFQDLIEVSFGDIKVYSIAAYDEWLAMSYGDYMQLPPENKRVTHGMKVWKIDESEK